MILRNKISLLCLIFLSYFLEAGKVSSIPDYKVGDKVEVSKNKIFCVRNKANWNEENQTTIQNITKKFTQYFLVNDNAYLIPYIAKPALFQTYYEKTAVYRGKKTKPAEAEVENMKREDQHSYELTALGKRLLGSAALAASGCIAWYFLHK